MVRVASKDKQYLEGLILGAFLVRAQKSFTTSNSYIYSLPFVKGIIRSKLVFRSYPLPWGYYFLAEELPSCSNSFRSTLVWLNPVYSSDLGRIVDYLVSSATTTVEGYRMARGLG